MQQNVTTGGGGDLCGLLVKQTDEGNLSWGLGSAEQRQAAPTIVSVVTHLSHCGGHEERKDEVSQQRRTDNREVDGIKKNKTPMVVMMERGLRQMLL